jgi:hypothetical protein
MLEDHLVVRLHTTKRCIRKQLLPVMSKSPAEGQSTYHYFDVKGALHDNRFLHLRRYKKGIKMARWP